MAARHPSPGRRCCRRCSNSTTSCQPTRPVEAISTVREHDRARRRPTRSGSSVARRPPSVRWKLRSPCASSASGQMTSMNSSFVTPRSPRSSRKREHRLRLPRTGLRAAPMRHGLRRIARRRTAQAPLRAAPDPCRPPRRRRARMRSPRTATSPGPPPRPDRTRRVRSSRPSAAVASSPERHRRWRSRPRSVPEAGRCAPEPGGPLGVALECAISAKSPSRRPSALPSCGRREQRSASRAPPSHCRTPVRAAPGRASAVPSRGRTGR